MKTKHSAIDRVKAHLSLRGCSTPVNGEAKDDLEMLVRRYDEVHELGEEYGEIELSPYMCSLMRVSGMPPSVSLTAASTAAAGM